ncbi:MAG: BatA domain-containing protein [Planctomycetota bacterium]|nr:BatA domain-containing protein [Planctomycetota bacterium]
MSFTNLSGGAVVLGALALVGVAFLLQRLKVRHREVVVPTTLFWREALERSDARKLVERFRHPLSFALICALLLLLWVALAGPAPDRTRGTHHLVLVDGGASMGRSLADAGAGPLAERRTRLDVALERAAELAEELPRARTRFVLTGAVPRTLLGPGEPTELLARRTADLVADAAPSRLAAELFELVEAHARGASLGFPPGEPVSVLVLGDLDAATAERVLARAGELTLEAVELPGELAANDAILGLGIAPAASGAWDAVDLWISTSGPAPAVLVGGQPRTPTPVDGGFALTDLGASGALVEVSLPAGDGLGLDDTAALYLPRRERLVVALDPALPAEAAGPLRAAVIADPGLDLLGVTTGDADVAIAFAPAGPLVPASLPTLRITEDADLAVVATRPPGTAPFEPLFEALALGSIGTDLGGEALAAPMQPHLAESVADGPATLAINGALLAAPFDLSEGRSLPLFVGLGTRWLAGQAELLPFAAVGRDLVTTERDGLGLPLRPRATGDFDLGEDRHHASLLDASTTFGSVAATLPPAADLGGGGDPDRTTPLLLLALALFMLEWFFLRTRRMP